ncbi:MULTISPECIES: stage II sporulation protein M [unclassified Amycolatopsis]|uniref:stage II sporulation protein M n=1 Tax=unclassified Amycolatopsis TaxID=2618356 RepID=UPI002875FFFF|nr:MULTISPECIES: stage II sporulation protein M [unclassified Amycolatopsis]MDS0134996.1 stage II sporulation protein M [Amycolatopsis sp. 505]MDS0148824.1 stage II sporulation protein M [Amycolatopsis sp. CM201R]
MDVDVFVAAHAAEWTRLGELTRRGGKLTGPEADELVTLYQRTATHLSIVRSVAPDPALLGRLSDLVARGRAAVSGSHNPAWREVARFFTRRFPAAVYLSRRWWIPAALASIAVMVVIAVWVARDPLVRASLGTPDELRELTKPGGDAETYYSTGPAASFAAQVWTNNAWVAATCLFLGVALGLPVIGALWLNSLNAGMIIGAMSAAGRGDVMIGLLLPHGLLELTAVFVAAGTGLKLGWTVIDPGRRSRTAALAEQGRSVVVMALGLTCVLLVSGVIEAFVTPSGWPTWLRVGIGAAVEVAFLVYVFTLGRRAAKDGEVGDLDARDAGDALPESA